MQADTRSTVVPYITYITGKSMFLFRVYTKHTDQEALDNPISLDILKPDLL